MALVVQTSAPVLKERGFRKRRHCFNRTVEDGLVQVIRFWMLPFEPPAWTEVPGLRERQYGTFAVELGIYVPDMARLGTPRSDWINPWNCQIRPRLGRLMGFEGGADVRWPIMDERAPATAYSAVVDHALPWLDAHRRKNQLLETFEAGGLSAFDMPPFGVLDFADLYAALGRPADQRRILMALLERRIEPAPADYLRTYLKARDCGDLVDLIKVRTRGKYPGEWLD